MADSFVIVRGGLVQNEPALPVFDLDCLGYDHVTVGQYCEVVDLRERLVVHFGPDHNLVSECPEWISEHEAKFGLGEDG